MRRVVISFKSSILSCVPTGTGNCQGKKRPSREQTFSCTVNTDWGSNAKHGKYIWYDHIVRLALLKRVRLKFFTKINEQTNEVIYVPITYMGRGSLLSWILTSSHHDVHFKYLTIYFNIIIMSGIIDKWNCKVFKVNIIEICLRYTLNDYLHLANKTITSHFFSFYWWDIQVPLPLPISNIQQCYQLWSPHLTLDAQTLFILKPKPCTLLLWTSAFLLYPPGPGNNFSTCYYEFSLFFFFYITHINDTMH